MTTDRVEFAFRPGGVVCNEGGDKCVHDHFAEDDLVSQLNLLQCQYNSLQRDYNSLVDSFIDRYRKEDLPGISIMRLQARILDKPSGGRERSA